MSHIFSKILNKYSSLLTLLEYSLFFYFKQFRILHEKQNNSPCIKLFFFYETKHIDNYIWWITQPKTKNIECHRKRKWSFFNCTIDRYCWFHYNENNWMRHRITLSLDLQARQLVQNSAKDLCLSIGFLQKTMTKELNFSGESCRTLRFYIKAVTFKFVSSNRNGKLKLTAWRTNSPSSPL